MSPTLTKFCSGESSSMPAFVEVGKPWPMWPPYQNRHNRSGIDIKDTWNKALTALWDSQTLLCYSVCISFCFILGSIEFFFLCLTLCRSNTAHTDVNKALLWRLSERTPATAVAVWTEKLLCDFQKPIESHSVKCGSVCSLWFSGKPYDWPNNEMLSSAENKEQSADPKNSFTN